jgi:hypothetical protein
MHILQKETEHLLSVRVVVRVPRVAARVSLKRFR